MTDIKARGKVPKTATVGEIIEIKTLLKHPMHTGRVKDAEGKIIPRKVITDFRVYFNGNLIFSIEIEPSLSSNPYIVFPFKAKVSGNFEFLWLEDTGKEYKMLKSITVI
mgnify:CR=1 FL=1|tara:strand:+ start:935 stop:1261 length:327 start_codon:yes stop_codon:yes gene_type:complete